MADVCSAVGTSTIGGWSPFLFVPGLQYGVTCGVPAGLGVDEQLVPVTHMADKTNHAGRGIWFYFARGCSDLLWDVGRTLLSRNRAHAAMLLQQRIPPCTDLPHGCSDEAAMQLVARWVENHTRGTWLTISKARREGGLSRNATIATLLGAAARGYIGAQPACLRSHVFASDGSLNTCGCNLTVAVPDSRIRSLGSLSGDPVLQTFAVQALANLSSLSQHRSDAGARAGLSSARQGRADVSGERRGPVRPTIDTIVMYEQPQGHGSRRWATEIWDVRHVPCEKPNAPHASCRLPPHAMSHMPHARHALAGALPAHQRNGVAVASDECGSALEAAREARSGPADAVCWDSAAMCARQGRSTLHSLRKFHA